MASRRGVHVRRLDNIHGVAVIPYSPYGLRTYRLRRISSTACAVIRMRGRERRTKWQRIYCSSILKNLPPSANCSVNLSAAILIPFSNSANPRQACLPISQRLNILKALPICFLNLRSREKRAPKRKAGSNYSLIQKLSTRKLSKPTATSAAEYRECLPHPVLRLKRKLIPNNFQIFIWTYNFLSVSWCYQTERKFFIWNTNWGTITE